MKKLHIRSAAWGTATLGFSLHLAAQTSVPAAPAPAHMPVGADRSQAAPTPTTGASAPATVAQTPTAVPGPELPTLSLRQVLQSALAQHPSIRLAENELLSSEANLKASESPFDTILTANGGHQYDRSPVLPSQSGGVPGYDYDVTDTTSAGVGANWLSRWGTTVAPSVGIARTHRRPGSAFAGSDLVTSGPLHTAQSNLTLTQALLRGLGPVGAASGVKAAQLSRDAARFLVLHTGQRQAFLALAAYWDFLAASRIVSILESNVERAQRLLDDSIELVKADERPEADLRQLFGNLANRKRELQDGLNSRAQALYALYETMGLSAEGYTMVGAADDFPAPQAPTWTEQEAIERAKSSRQDLEALRQTYAAADASYQGADWNTLPALDLSVSLGANGAVDGGGPADFASAPVRNIPGLSGAVGLSLELPVRNLAREAERDAQLSAQQRARIALNDLERRIPIEAVKALFDLRFAVEALQESIVASGEFEEALKNERARSKEGVGTVIDVVFAQDQLVRAQQTQVFLQARYATALTRLLFETGQLPSGPDSLGQLPAALSAANPAPGGAP